MTEPPTTTDSDNDRQRPATTGSDPVQTRRTRSLPGTTNPHWKGGRIIDPNGYVLIKHPGHHLADVRGYVYEHRLVAEAMLDRPLEPGEWVCHINHTPGDNRPENLNVITTRRTGRPVGRGGPRRDTDRLGRGPDAQEDHTAVRDPTEEQGE